MGIDTSGDATVDTDSSVDPPNNGTLCWWQVKYNNSGTQRQCGNDGFYEIFCNTSGNMRNDLLGNSQSMGNVVLNDLEHYAARYNLTSERKQSFRNGVEISDDFHDFVSPTSAIFEIGNRTGASASNGHQGEIYEMRLYDRELSDEEIAAIFEHRGNDGIVDGLLYWWRLDEQADGDAIPATSAVIKDIVGGLHCSEARGSPDWINNESLTYRRRA